MPLTTRGAAALRVRRLCRLAGCSCVTSATTDRPAWCNAALSDLPAVPALTPAPVVVRLLALDTAAALPAEPALRALPALQAAPALPGAPALPAVPALPTMAALLALPASVAPALPVVMA